MKKLFSIIVIALIGAFVMSSCEKEYETEPLKTVNVSGEVHAWLDLTGSEIQNAPNGTKIIFRTNAANLCKTVDGSYAYNTLQYEATVSDGKYSIDLPAVNFQSVTYNITPVEFVAEQKQTTPAGAVIKKVYVVNPLTSAPSIDVQEGEVHYRVDVEYM